jgi:N-hydroxyarylamine O-acetyltransferase
VYGAGGLGPPYDHLTLAVHLPDGSGPWLADVGFGRHSVGQLILDSRTDQQDPGGRFLLTDTADGDVDVLKNGEPQYRMELRGRSLPDFVATCWWQQTSPLSTFIRETVCSRLTEDGGRISISGRTLIRTSGGTRTEEQLPDDDALLAAYRDEFGITLDRVPGGPGQPPPT